MRQVGMLVMFLALAGPAAAGEIVLANGSRVEGDLGNGVLMVSTGSDVIEVRADSVAVLSPGELRLKDGRVVRGTLVGGRLRARTPLGELVIKTDELRVFQADGVAPTAAAAPALPVAAPARETAPAAPTKDSGVPPATLNRSAAHSGPSTAPTAVFASTTGALTRSLPSSRLQVVTPETSLHRDALANAPIVGTVHRGDYVTYLDYIDRRLWIMKTLIFDGGFWIKVRAADGMEGWVPAETVREAR